MFFHVRRPTPNGLSPPSQVLGTEDDFELSTSRVALAIGFVIVLALFGFLAKWAAWDEAATAFLHLVEVSAGGIGGVLVGERTALARRP